MSKAGTPKLQYAVGTWNQSMTSDESGVLQIWRGVTNNTVQLIANDVDGGAEAGVLLDFRVAAHIAGAMCLYGRKAAQADISEETTNWPEGLPKLRDKTDTYDREATRAGTGVVEIRWDDRDNTVMIIVRDNSADASVALRLEGDDMVQAGAALAAEARLAGAGEE